MEDVSIQKPDKSTEQTAKREAKSQIVWSNVIGFLLLHLIALYGLYISILSARLLTWVYGKLKRHVLKVYVFPFIVSLFQEASTR
jgi:hypothetical protein